MHGNVSWGIFYLVLHDCSCSASQKGNKSPRRPSSRRTSSWLKEGAENTPRHLKTRHRLIHPELEVQRPNLARSQDAAKWGLTNTDQICVIHIWDGKICAKIWETTCIYSSFIHSRNNTYLSCPLLRQPLRDICSSHPSSLNRRLCSQHLLSSWSNMCPAVPKGGEREEV